MLQNQQPIDAPLCTVMSQVVYFAYLSVSRRKRVNWQTFYQRSCSVIFGDICNALNGYLAKTQALLIKESLLHSNSNIRNLNDLTCLSRLVFVSIAQKINLANENERC